MIRQLFLPPTRPYTWTDPHSYIDAKGEAVITVGNMPGTFNYIEVICDACGKRIAGAHECVDSGDKVFHKKCVKAGPK